MISVRIPKDEYDRAKGIAEAHGVPVTEHIRQALVEANLQAYLADAAAVQAAADAVGFTAEWDADVAALDGEGRE
ncbi:hypothetical protein LO763_13815 [Glycomyces sp. A-F 0318]|uniref:hypothetical protein n=1 Tax=Glycomyces amatae TaxID=2881355 RepID=UPI001E3B1595|nr:hypothetical protein [Glycomyces amatae]MCD0444700.1 hypothetical protein [Glycomyces amatae]